MRTQITTIFILLFTHLCTSQELAFKQYTIHDGLVQMQVLDIFEDSKGYIWIGTKGGVSKFNGDSFENFKESNGLLDNLVEAIREDTFGNIWLLSRKGVVRYDGSKFTEFQYPKDWLPTYGKIEINSKNEIYIFRTEPPQLVRLSDAGYKIIEQDIYPNRRSAILAWDKENDDILIASKIKGYCKIKNDQLEPLGIDGKVYSIWRESQLDLMIYSIINGSIRSYYSLTKHLHLFDYDTKNKRFLNLTSENLNNPYYKIHRSQLMKFGSENSIKTIGEIDYGFANQMFRDSKGIFWIKTDEGLIQWFGEGITNYTQEEFTYSWGFVEDIDGSIWIPKFGSGLYNYKNGEFTENSDYLKLANSKSLYFGSLLDKNKNLIFPNNQGILKYDRKKFELLKPFGAGVSPTPFILYEDKERDLLLAGTREGIDVFKDYEHFGYWGKKANIHSCTFIISITKDTTNAYWLGSFYGLSRFDWETKTAKNYTIENGKLPSSGVMSSTKDTWGGIWFGGRDALMKYDYSNDSIYTIPIPNIGDIGVITEAENKRLLVGATSGVYWIDLEKFYDNGELDYYLMNQNNGYMGIEPTQNSFLNDSKGNVWLASSTITTKFNPDKLDFKNYPLKTAITTLNGERLRYSTLAADSTITIEESKIKIQFEAIGSNRPSKTEYSYLLEGSDEDWSDWSTGEEVEFTNLSSGNYTFKVKSRSNTENAVNEWSRLNIKVDLPLYKEPFFTMGLIITLFFFLLLIGIIAYINHSKVKEREEHNKNLAEKNAKIETLHKELAHRVKNNLFFISTLMKMQGKRVENEEAKQAVKESEARLEAMSLLHRKLHLGENESHVNIGGYLQELCGNLQYSFPHSGNQPQIKVKADDVMVEGEPAVRIGLIVNELVTNSFKYAFKEQEKPEINVTVQSTGNGTYRLTYQDNGIGIPADFEINKSKSMGIKLIHTLTKQLNGTVEVSNKNGAHFQFNFKQNRIAI